MQKIQKSYAAITFVKNAIKSFEVKTANVRLLNEFNDNDGFVICQAWKF